MPQSKKYQSYRIRSAKRQSNSKRPQRLSMIQNSPRRSNGPKLQRVMEHLRLNPAIRSPKFTKTKRKTCRF